MPQAPAIVFERWPAPGLDFVTNPGRTEKRHQPETMVAEVALLDYDGDGRRSRDYRESCTIPRCRAAVTASVRSETPSLHRMLLTWIFTVPSVISSA